MSTSGGVGGRGPQGPLLPDWTSKENYIIDAMILAPELFEF